MSTSSRVRFRTVPVSSVSSALSSSVMRSSDGFLARQSMYSSNMPLPRKSPVGTYSSPSSILRPSSSVSRMASWSCSGMPSSMPITRIGIWAPRSPMKSKPPLPTSGSRLRAQNSRTWPSRASIFLGVKTRDITLRWMSWMGGSSMRTMPGGISMPALMSSRVEPLPDRYVSQSTRPFSTSSNRLSA